MATAQEHFDRIMRDCEPQHMSQEQALDFLQTIQSMLESSIEALEEEIEEGGE